MITSRNLHAVIGDLERLQKLPEKINEQLTPGKFTSQLKALAEDILTTVLHEDEHWIIPIMVGTITGAKTESRLIFTMTSISTSFGTMESVDDVELTLDPESGDPNWGLDVHREIVEWVEEYKDLEIGRDTNKDGIPKSAEAIAARLMHAIEVDPDAWFRSDNPDGLARKIGMVPLDVKRVESALKLILEIWVSYTMLEIEDQVSIAFKMN